MFTFALVWLLSWCLKDSQPVFRIHGLWPSREYCAGSSLNSTEIAPLMPWLQEYWSHNVSFLEHEWSKHGTCTSLTQYDYFRNALALYFRFNPTATLVSNNIVPSDTTWYDLDGIVRALSETNFSGTLECVGTNRSVLSQVQYSILEDSLESPAGHWKSSCSESVQLVSSKPSQANCDAEPV
jgi:ribonuclease I